MYGHGGGGGGYDGGGRGGRGGGGRYDNRRGDDRGGGRGGPYGRGPPDRDRSRNRGDPNRRQQEMNGIPVQANLFRLQFTVQGRHEWYLYHIQMNHSTRRPKKDENGKDIRDEEGKVVFGEPQIGKSIFDDRDLTGDTEAARNRQERRNQASHLSRRVIQKLQREHNLDFWTDGSRLAYSARKIDGLSTEADDRPQRARRQKDNTAGIYGPADDGSAAVPQEQAPIIKPWKVYPPIQVFKDCDEDDPEAGLVGKKMWVQVKLTEVGTISFDVQGDKMRLTEGDEAAPCQAINLAVQNAMLGKMLALEKKDNNMIYFKHDPSGSNYDDLRSVWERNFRGEPPSLPVYGLLQNARMTADGVCRLVVDLGLGWKKPELDSRNNPIPLLQPDGRGPGGTLAGIRIPDVHSVIPEELWSQIEKELSKLTFHVRYKCGEGWFRKMMEKPLRSVPDNDLTRKEREVKKMAKKGGRNKRMIRMSAAEKSEDKKRIAWAADEERFHSFKMQYMRDNGEREELRPTTVAEYYERRYDIRLMYPKMPLVRVSEQEYFPVEFLFQAQGPAKHTDDVKDKVTSFALNFNDKFACKDRIDEIKNLLTERDVIEPLREKLQLLNMSLDTSPLELRSKVLRMPKLTDRDNSLTVTNGSWNLKNVHFARPATLHSFAVVNLAGLNPQSQKTLPEELFKALQNHDIGLPYKGRSDVRYSAHLWQCLTVPCDPMGGNDQFEKSFTEAKERARTFFLRDPLRNGFCFHTMAHVEVVEGEKAAKEVVVFPENLVAKNASLDGCMGVLDYAYFRGNRPTHTLTIGNEDPMLARLMYRIDGRGDLLDPLEVMYVDGSNFALRRSSSWDDLRSAKVEPVFHITGSKVFTPDEVDNFELLQQVSLGEESGEPVITTVGHSVRDISIECPSMVFVILPTKSSGPYSMSKLMSYCKLNVNSQTITMESFNKQKFPAQFCSNLALKINTKLSTMKNRECAWEWHSTYDDGSPDLAQQWLGEVPTLIIGLAKASGQGQSDSVKMVVVGSGYMNFGGQACCFEARAQSKSPIIDRSVVKSIAKNLIIQFYRYNEFPPARIIIVRSGEHDGHFRGIIDNEIKGVREGFLEAKPGDNDCTYCEDQKQGCHHCCPFITCLVAQGGGGGRHNIRLVPVERSTGGRKNPNVPSGTCASSHDLLLPPNADVLDHEKKLCQDGEQLMVFDATYENLSDFFLVPQGGLKGTSNGVFYRVILNENRLFGELNSGTTPLTSVILQQLIYSLSFIYGKATKAPRDCALVRSADLLANTLLGVIDRMDRPMQNAFLPITESPGGLKTYGDKLLAGFGPYSFEEDENGYMVLGPGALQDAIRSHVLA